jgi:hypothetical protein
MNGEWHKEGKASRWTIDVDWIADRIIDAKFWAEYRVVGEWWVAMPRSVKELMKVAYPNLADKTLTPESKLRFLATTAEWKKHLAEASAPDVP